MVFRCAIGYKTRQQTDQIGVPSRLPCGNQPRMNANGREKRQLRSAVISAQGTFQEVFGKPPGRRVTRIVALRPKSSEDRDRYGQILPSTVVFGVSFRHPCLGQFRLPAGLADRHLRAFMSRNCAHAAPTVTPQMAVKRGCAAADEYLGSVDWQEGDAPWTPLARKLLRFG